jgi:branched-chain amino acid transport system permease protein
MGALVVGLNVRHLFALTFAIGCACLGAAGAILMLLIDVHPYLGPPLTLLAFIIVIVGGMGSLPGAMLGGILIGASEALAGLILQPSLKSAFSFGLLILVLLVRPQGLLGRAAQ